MSARSSKGPVVGKPSTIETMAEPGDDLRQQSADAADDGIKCHAQRILDDEGSARAKSLGAGGDDILLLEFVQQLGAQDADETSRAGGADHDNRHGQVRQHIPELRQAPRFAQVLRGEEVRRA